MKHYKSYRKDSCSRADKHRKKKTPDRTPSEEVILPYLPVPRTGTPVIIKPVFDELLKTLSAETILERSRKNGERPFGYVLDYIKDVYGYTKPEAWDTAAAVCKHFKDQKHI